MRSAYFVYDLDAHQVSIAQTNFNATSQNILEISKAGAVPGVSSTASGTVPTTVAGAAATTAAGTATWDLGTSTATATSKPKSAGVNLQVPSRSISLVVFGVLALFSAMV
jgi:hypothetical protein